MAKIFYHSRNNNYFFKFAMNEDIFYTEETLMHTNDDRIDRKLRVLLNNKITGDWCEMDSKMFKEINTEELKPHQVFLREEIERWDCE